LEEWRREWRGKGHVAKGRVDWEQKNSISIVYPSK